MNPTTNGPRAELHITFLFHCAFARRPGGRQTDVLLAPGVTPAMVPQTNGTHHATNGGSQAGPALHRMEHIAGLRVPYECIVAEEGASGFRSVLEDPVVTYDRALNETRTQDATWRLEGYDVWIDPDVDPTDAKAGSTAASNLPPADVLFTASEGDATYRIADFPTLAPGFAIDHACFEDDLRKVPELLTQGGRVRIWGGTLRCGIPTGGLKNRRWNTGNGEPIGLSDRMEFRKTLKKDTIRVWARHFITGDSSYVTLRPNAQGIIRMHVTNDPFAQDTHALYEPDPCARLPHFASYSVLLRPAGTLKPELRTPSPESSGRITVLEGNSICCPCTAAP